MPLPTAHLKVVTIRIGTESPGSCKESETMEFRGRNVIIRKRRVTNSGPQLYSKQ